MAWDDVRGPRSCLTVVGRLMLSQGLRAANDQRGRLVCKMGHDCGAGTRGGFYGSPALPGGRAAAGSGLASENGIEGFQQSLDFGASDGQGRPDLEDVDVAAGGAYQNAGTAQVVDYSGGGFAGLDLHADEKAGTPDFSEDAVGGCQ